MFGFVESAFNPSRRENQLRKTSVKCLDNSEEAKRGQDEEYLKGLREQQI